MIKIKKYWNSRSTKIKASIVVIIALIVIGVII